MTTCIIVHAVHLRYSLAIKHRNITEHFDKLSGLLFEYKYDL